MNDLYHYHWQLIGDPTVLGWITFVAYLLAALVSWHASRLGHIRAQNTGSLVISETCNQQRLRWCWLGMGLLMLLLGLNKQLDLQTFFTEIGKVMAHDQGWYAWRRQVQVLFVGLLAVGLCVVAVAAAYVLRPVLSRVLPALLGLAMIFIFVVLRALVFHVLHSESGAEPMAFLWVLELTGIGLVAWNALRAPQSIDKKHS